MANSRLVGMAREAFPDWKRRFRDVGTALGSKPDGER
jgi:hypothetical protein